jgi:hypothetical protein
MKRILTKMFFGELETWPGRALGLLWFLTIGWVAMVIMWIGAIIAMFDCAMECRRMK